jgi:hypothetical protein
LKKKLEMITEASDDATEQEMELEMEITRLESETLDERNQRKKDEEERKKEEARQREDEEDRKKEEARQRKEEAQKRKEEEARQREEEKDRKMEEARQRKEEEKDRKKEDDRKKEEARKREEEEARQRVKEQEEQARQRKEEQEEQAPKAQGKCMAFDDRMEDLKRFKETHGHANVTIREDKSLGQFCNKMRHTHKNPGNGKQLTNERIAAFDAMGFNWTSQEYVTRSFDDRINELEEYKKMHGYVNVKIHEDRSLNQFCAGARHSLKQVEKVGTMKLTKERIKRLDDLGFEW